MPYLWDSFNKEKETDSEHSKWLHSSETVYLIFFSFFCFIRCRNVMFLSHYFLFWNVSQNLLLLQDEIKDKILGNLPFKTRCQNKTAKHGPSIPVTTCRNYLEETRQESNPHLAPRPQCKANPEKSPTPHGWTVPSNTIKIPHIPPPWPGVGGGGGRVGISIDKWISKDL